MLNVADISLWASKDLMSCHVLHTLLV